MNADRNETPPVVLVVDDSPQYLGLMGRLLADQYAVRVANCGRRALELAVQSPLPDVVLLDVLMPDLDGHEVLARLRADPRTADIPVIFLTSLDAAGDELAGLLLGAADYIAKPGQPDVVRARVRTQVDLKRSRDGLRERNAQMQAEIERSNRLERELAQTVANLEAFSYTVSHDLRAPLQAIGSFARWIREAEGEALTVQGQRRMDRIVKCAQEMDTMIDDILACAKAEREDMRENVVDTRQLAEEVAAQFEDAYPQSTVTVGALPLVLGDRAMLRQVFSNLIGNALKFSAAEPSPQVEVTAGCSVEGVAVMVRDNGPGFNADQAGRLFTLFQRLHTRDEFPGTGVGLAIVKRLMERHGGSVRAESEPGAWTTFTIVFPPEADGE